MQQDINAIETLRLQLLDNGYTPIRNRDKRTFMKGWPHAVIDEGEIRRWTRRFSRDKGTGIRVEDGLAVIDFDIDDKAMMARIVNAVLDALPQLEDPNVPLLVRGGKGAKEAWFCRTAELFSRIHSRAWIRPGEDVDAGAHRVEIFGGASPRQFGSFGPHTVDADGAVTVTYRWADRSPADTRKSELPELTKAQFFLIADIVERELAAAGWTPVAKSTKGENDVQRVYDLTDEMQFDVDTGDRLSLQQLRELAAAYDGRGDTLRCSAGWLEGPSAKRTDRCLVSVDRAGGVAILETASGVSHREASLAPRDRSEELNRITEKLKELDEKTRNKLSSGDSASTVAAKLRATHAFCPHQRDNVVPIWASSITDGITLANFRSDMLKFSEIEVGPKGGEKRINPADIWACDKKRLTVAGLRLRPDKPRPTYEEGGQLWINVYDPPAHDLEGGEYLTGIEFMEQLLPDEREREWFLDWLAYKHRRPEIPGPAVLMVARDFGTGRGTLGKLVARLFGARYVKAVPFHIFAGRSYQSQYTEWAASAVVVLVNESSEAGQGTVYATKRDTYEHIKEIVDPRPVEREFIVKGEKSFSGVSFASYIISTNHIDALPIPQDDRRIAVLSNGQPRDQLFWSRVNLWIEDDANVAAFARWLAARDVSGYSPFDLPLRTKAKDDMADASRSDLDKGMALAIMNLPSDVFVFEQAEKLMRDAAREFGLDYPDKWSSVARRALQSKYYRVGVRDGTNWHPKINGKRYAVYGKTESAARIWMTSDRLREEVLKNGDPGGAGNVSTALMRLVDERKENK